MGHPGGSRVHGIAPLTHIYCSPCCQCSGMTKKYNVQSPWPASGSTLWIAALADAFYDFCLMDSVIHTGSGMHASYADDRERLESFA